MARLSFRQRLRSWFDGTMDRGTPALIGWLGLASLVLIVGITVLVRLFAPEGRDQNPGDVLWESLLRAMDPGTIGGDQGSAIFLALMLAVTIGGIFIVSSLVGVLTTGMEKRIAELRKGRSRVAERGHAVILGWSDQVFVVVSELVKAYQGGRTTVVILADLDKVEMEDQIKARVGDLGRVRVICRSGSPLRPIDLEIASPDTARSIMVLSPTGEDADIDVIKALLLLNYRNWTAERPHVVASVQDSHNLAAARLAAGPHAQIVDADDITVRLVVQSNRQSGLSTVCTDLLDFSGNEIYMRTEPRLSGSTYGQALHAYELGCPIGLRHADGTLSVNPAPDLPIVDGDQIIVIAEDDLLIRLAQRPARPVEDAIVATVDGAAGPDRTLLIGWNTRGQQIIDLLDRLVEPGSHVDIAAVPETVALPPQPVNLTVGVKACEPTNRRHLEDLDLASYNHIVVLSDDTVAPDRADDRTLVTLLHLRDIEVRLGDPFSIVTEMNDDANREVAQVTKADDFIVSTKLISLLMTQLAENRHLQAVFAELFDPSGSEIHLKPAADYVIAGRAANFATVIEAARRRGETAIGYRVKARGDEAPSYGVVLNPAKSAALSLSSQDSVILVAAD